ncbi:MAG: dienelactone hydrolase family protein [Alphaproteobacteria bacterium]|nr:dienelactone hydrolase family protein [Alphaproteobacteria bacterium]
MPDVSINALDGPVFGGYAAMPKNNCGPGLVVIQEIFGVNDDMRAVCDAFASQGYMAVCPDLFWRLKPGVRLSPQEDADRDRAFELYKAFDVEAGLRDLLATMAHMRCLSGCSGKVGVAGYGLGGKLAWLMAARSDVDGSVSYYGTGIESALDEVHDIRQPALLHIAEKDEFLAAPSREKVLEAAARNPLVSTHIYPGARHAFARPGGPAYRKDAAGLAGQRTHDFLSGCLLTG